MDQLQVDQLCLSYGKQSVIKDVSFTISKGSIVGLIGPNGAGKSSILKVLAGLVRPDAGKMMFNENDMTLNALKNHAGFHIDSPSFYPFLSALENLKILMKMNNLEVDLQGLLVKVGLSKAGNKKVRHFSTGMKQRLAIAQTLLRSPEVLVLDEPFNGLDPHGFQDLKHLLEQLHAKGMTILVSSHLLNELEQFAHHFILLHEGKVALDISKKELQQLKNTVQFEFDGLPTAKGLSLLKEFEANQISNTFYEVKRPKKDVAELVKKLVDVNCIPIMVNTVNLLQQKYLDITA